MSRVSVSKSGIRPVVRNATLERHAQRFLELRRELEQIEYFCKGTVLKRMMKCGKAQCACASDASKRHGPYFELTYKANGKTVNVKLSREAAPLYRAAAQQYHKLKTLLSRLDKLSKTILRHQAKSGRIQAPGLIKNQGLFRYPRFKRQPKTDRLLLTDWFYERLAVVLK